MANFSMAAASGIPLHCNICPKKPDFSDTSHLLTHIASKQHLSNYFKLKVRADPAAQRDVDEYDRWYHDWNLDDLMRERMSHKEKRGRGSSSGGGGGSRRGSAAPKGVSSSRSGSVPMSAPAPRREASLRNNLLDPQLGPRIKTEPNSRPSTPGLLPQYDPMPMDGHRGYGMPINGWNAMPYNPSPSLAGTPNGYASDADDDDDDDASSYSYAARPARRRKLSDESNSWPGSMTGSLQGSAYLGEDQDVLDAPNDMARLKGEIWPGMDIFDSATPEMRRKRNQKKATSVIVQLQATSEIVTPTELVFDQFGQFKRERIISGEPNSADDPLRGETTPEPDEPPAKKRATRRRPRAALTEKDPNGGRNLRSSRRAGSHHPPFGKNRPHYIDGSDELDDDDGLTYGKHRAPQRRSGLSIHRDNTGPDITFDRPSKMNYLTSGFPEPYPGSQPYGLTARPEPGNLNGHYRETTYMAQPQQFQRGFPKSSAGFRPADVLHQPAKDLSAFGALTNQSFFNTGNDFTTPPINNTAFSSFQPGFAPSAHIPATTQNFANDTSLQMQSWDVFGLGNDPTFGSLDLSFNTATETNGANPLFFENNTGLQEDDDEGTISAPASEKSPA